MDDSITVRCLQGWKGSLVVSATGTLDDFDCTPRLRGLNEGDVLSLTPGSVAIQSPAVCHTGIARIIEGAAVVVVAHPSSAPLSQRNERTRKLAEVSMRRRCSPAVASADYAGLRAVIKSRWHRVSDPTDRKGLAIGASRQGERMPACA